MDSPLQYLEFLPDDDEVRNFPQSMEMDNQQALWSQLPAPAVERIYSFLSREEQCYMSQVCRNWSKIYSSPILWRHFTFYLSEYERTTDLYPEVRLAKRYGHFFDHVRVICERAHLAPEDVIRRQLKLFFESLSCHSQLLSISFKDVAEYFFTYGRELEDLTQSLANLLKSQNRLQRVEIKNAYFEKTEAVEIFKAILSKSSTTLNVLILEGFVKEYWDDDWNDITIDVPSTFSGFKKLQELTIDYSQFFETMMNRCHEYGKESNLLDTGVLEKIVFNCDDSAGIIYSGISPEAWKYFRKIFPALRLDIIIKSSSCLTRNDFDVFVVRHMPVRCLILSRFCKKCPLGSIFGHLTECGINDCLQVLSITGLENTTNFVRDLLGFLQMFHKLRELRLLAVNPVEALDTIFEYWIGNGAMSLKTVHIDIANVLSRRVVSNYKNISDKYVVALQQMGINLTLIVDGA